MASKLTQPVCHGCGRYINGMAVGQYGVVCPSCGFVTQRLALKVDATSGVDAKGGVETKTPDQV
jgi:rRNA maturation endonuclease Nob1